ncbi:MAG TPA: serine/threonine-protein kinase [Terriglobales bacterium]|nr:serine/threonine-protein kinase [Terriglobales bacterium]
MPTKIGRFEIQGQLSRSAFATVYKALDTETKQIIALKVVALNNLADRDDLVKTVFEEADRSKPLNSHNIAVLFGVGDEEGQLLAGAEYVQGNSVATTLARKDGFSIWDLQDIARQVCHALDHAQVHKVVHHSLEPAKVMVQWDGMVKVLGFGISSMSALSAMSAGTPEVLHYTSPEQLRGEACDHRSALFSLGAILYEMATEQKAFPGQTAEQIRSAILDTVPPLPHRLKANLSPALSALIMKAISKSPGNRFQSGQELVRDLDQCNTAATKVAPPAAAVKPKTQATAGVAGAAAKLAPKPIAPAQPSTAAKPAAPSRPAPKVAASAAAPASAEPNSKPGFNVDPMMAEPGETGAAVAKTSFSDLEELPPLKEVFVPSVSPSAEPAAAADLPPMLPPLPAKKAAEKPSIPVRELAQNAVAEIRKTPPKLYVYGVGGAVLLIAIIVSAMAMHTYLADHEGDSSKPAAVPEQAASAKKRMPLPVAPTPAPPPPQPEAAPPPAQPEPTLTVEEQPQAPETSRRHTKTHAVAPVLAQLTVSSAPAGAQITFDGSPLCQSPCTLTDIAPGQHIITASKSGFTSQSRTIHLKAGTSTVSLQLNAVAPAATTLMVSSTPPGAAIVIDGRDTGRLTPTLFSFDRPGTHTVLVKRTGYLEGSSTVNVQSGQAANASVTLKRLGDTEDIRSAGGKFKKVFGRGESASMGIVSVKTQPKGAQIMVNGRVLDKTAPFDFYLNPGTYEIDITMSGYRSLHRVIDVEQGEKVAIEEPLAAQ